MYIRVVYCNQAIRVDTENKPKRSSEYGKFNDDVLNMGSKLWSVRTSWLVRKNPNGGQTCRRNGKESWKEIIMDKMYKMKSYKRDFESGEINLISCNKSYNLQFFDRFKHRTNYAIEIYEKVKNKWVLIYTEL